MRTLAAAICGIVFGVGLAVSGMTNPAKVLAFLDVTGHWDPTLAFVMAGALTVTAVGFAVAGRSARPWFAETFSLPTRRDFDRDLLLGAVLFGVGWGLVGLCPGPALASLWRASSEVFLFVGAMIGGVLLHRLPAQRGTATLPTPAANYSDQRVEEHVRPEAKDAGAEEHCDRPAPRAADHRTAASGSSPQPPPSRARSGAGRRGSSTGLWRRG
jgi:uncharacterized membrane protein YedE/YeeE